MSLSARALAGDQRAVARLATYIENDDPIGREASEKLYPHTGSAFTIGVTGPPGAGKSSLINALIGAYRARGTTVAVVAIDPSSPVSGGATLGDRIRMLDRFDDPGLFIRSLAARGGSGGLAPSTAAVIHLLDAAGYERILVETVGVGQDDVEVTRLVDFTLLLQVPGLGDSVQAMKAGILELADLYVINKADLAGADALAKELRSMLLLSHDIDRAQRVVQVSSVGGEGVPDLTTAIEGFRLRLQASGELEQRREAIASHEVMSHMERDLRARLGRLSGSADAPLVAEVAQRRVSPRAAATRVLEAVAHTPAG